MKIKEARIILFNFLLGKFTDDIELREAIKIILEFPAIVPESPVGPDKVNQEI